MKAFNEWKVEKDGSLTEQVKRRDAIEINNLAGTMLLRIEDYLSRRQGWKRDSDLTGLPPEQRHLLEELRSLRKEIAHRLSQLIDPSDHTIYQTGGKNESI